MTTTNFQNLQIGDPSDKVTLDAFDEINAFETVSYNSSNIFLINGDFANLSFQQALYGFPKKKIAVIDEDGNIIASNDECLAEAETIASNSSPTPGLAVNYLDFLLSVLPHSDALRSITKLRQVIRGAAMYFAARCNSGYIGEIIAYPLSDCANALVVIHETYDTGL